jgi:hypothetical protein
MMELPARSPDLETAKMKIASRFVSMENRLMEEIAAVATSGFADQRLCAIARADIEKGFMALHKALRFGENNDYGKIPLDEPLHRSFTPPTDEKSVIAEEAGKIEWQDLPKA